MGALRSPTKALKNAFYIVRLGVCCTDRLAPLPPPLCCREPVLTRCGHSFCRGCVLAEIASAGPAAACPVCRRPGLSERELPPNLLAKTLVEELPVRCIYGCRQSPKGGWEPDDEDGCPDVVPFGLRKAHYKAEKPACPPLCTHSPLSASSGKAGGWRALRGARLDRSGRDSDGKPPAACKTSNERSKSDVRVCARALPFWRRGLPADPAHRLGRPLAGSFLLFFPRSFWGLPSGPSRALALSGLARPHAPGI